MWRGKTSWCPSLILFVPAPIVGLECADSKTCEWHDFLLFKSYSIPLNEFKGRRVGYLPL